MSRLGGGGGTGPRLGGGGGADDFRSPVNGGGTLKPEGVVSSSIGVFEGRGGGGGPGLATLAVEDALALPDGCMSTPGFTANLPASANGGGARNLGWGLASGDGVAGGDLDLDGDGALAATGLRDGGGAGGGPLRLAVVDPVFSGLSRAAGGGGGGGGALPPEVGMEEAIPFAIACACCCLM